MGDERDEQQDAPTGETATVSPSPTTPTAGSPAPAQPTTAPSTAPSPKASVAANLACLAVLPLAVLGGALAHPHVASGRGLSNEVVGGACVFSVLGVVVAVFARLARRRTTEWLALATASLPWVVLSIASDLVHRHGMGGGASRALIHLNSADKLLKHGNLAASSTAVTLAALALALALLARNPGSATGAKLSRALVVASLGPGAFLALAISSTAHHSGFALLAIVLSTLALDRVARNLDPSSPRALALAWAATLAAGAAVAASTTGAASRGIWEALPLLYRTVEPAQLASLVGMIRTLELSQLSPIFAVLPGVALLFTIDADARGHGWSHVPRVAFVLSALVVGLVLWLDGRNALDARRQIDEFLRTSGGTTLIADAPAIGALPLLTNGRDLEQEGFVLVTARGEVRYRGASVPGGLSGLPQLAHDDVLPPVMLDPRAPSSMALSIVAGANGAGLREVRFVGRGASGSGLAAVEWGPRFSPTPRDREGHIVLVLRVTPGRCTLMSSAGDPIEMEGCDELERNLRDRKRMEPNRLDIVVAPTAELEVRALLRVLDLLESHGYRERYATDGSSLR